MPAPQPRASNLSRRPPPKANYNPFCLSVKGHVKMLRLVLIVTSLAFFIVAQAPEPYIVVTGFEVFITFFFIMLYLLRLDRLMKCLFWPLLDAVNSFVAIVFMIIISVLALIPETTTLTVLGGVFGLLATACCIADAALIYRKLLLNPSGPYQKKPSHDKDQFF
ncbi:chemokine-like factor isoform X2 [Dasypus novemcinctus]|uniref:chemokine-like factor isoform X2 n=1 Tax=Dasypus novemcinctus TaxID=9361 RepID=UPI0003289244|nr:chemokine-like factor isoform X3 [Dasypus novemcinctus]